MTEGSPSSGWRDVYAQMGVDAEGWDEDPLDGLRGHEDELEEIAESDAPDAPVAKLMLRLVRGDEISPDDVAEIHPEVSNSA